MTQTERREAIREYLFSERFANIENLANEFGVSKRTIRYDVEALTCLYPVETVRGRYGGGVKLADWYHPSRSKLAPEQMALLKKLAPSLNGSDLVVMNSIISQFAP
ncbi:MAG: DeoR family transcriptional regulator [Clostridia bacterium]|nr:DeoR family transcriptional regulator [Clostridia bacterium]